MTPFDMYETLRNIPDIYEIEQPLTHESDANGTLPRGWWRVCVFRNGQNCLRKKLQIFKSFFISKSFT